MKRYTILTILNICLYLNTWAQIGSGTTIHMGVKSEPFTFTHTYNTNNATNTFGFSPNDITYEFTITKAMDISISHCGSVLKGTLVWLADQTGTTMSYDQKDYSDIDYCPDRSQFYAEKKNLSPGTYYLISEGFLANGEITTTITTSDLGYRSDNDDNNYIRTKTYLYETGSEYMETIQYFDGLGRPKQVVQKGITPTKKDLANHINYDAFGNQQEVWLPVVSDGNGNYVPFDNTFKQKSKSFYNNDPNAFSYARYDNSPLNRPLREYGPGADWHGKHAVQTDYGTNDATSQTRKCLIYEVVSSGLNTYFKKNGTYAKGTLFVTKISDEDGNTTYEFKNKLGQVLLTRQMEGTVPHDTYYLYDIYGNLSYVFPPMLSDIMSGKKDGTGIYDTDSDVKKYAYVYKYDRRKRCIKKRLPGCDWIYYVYDKADRLILSQDGEQRKKQEWSFTKYDAFGRVIMTGYNKITITPDTLRMNYRDIVVKEDAVEGYSTPAYGYTWVSLPEAKASGVQTVNYYDNYWLVYYRQISDVFEYYGKEGYPEKFEGHGHGAKGLLTATREKFTDGSGEKITVYYYDYQGRVVQKVNNNHTGYHDREFTEYNFSGQPVKRFLEHTARLWDRSVWSTEEYKYEYDHAGRLLETRHQYQYLPERVLVRNAYDQLGRISTVYPNNSSQIGSFYAYNIRSWLTNINGYLFSQELKYGEESISDPDLMKTYNGNISKIKWKYRTLENKDNEYYCRYDGLSRLNRFEVGTMRGMPENIGYSAGFRYDKNGNMTYAYRVVPPRIPSWVYDYLDDMDFVHNGNQLVTVRDYGDDLYLSNAYDFKDLFKKGGVWSGWDDIQYNLNGSMVANRYKGMRINYNYLNLPEHIDVDNRLTKGTIDYLYTASGEKLSATYDTYADFSLNPMMAITPYDYQLPIGNPYNEYHQRIDYIGNKIYKNEELDKILTENGFIKDNKYYFYIKDHLGNNRLVVDENGNIVQRNDYYPFGMPTPQSTSAGVQPYMFNGKEFDTMHGLNQYDYHARQHDPALARFTTVDPMAEKYYSISPYAYVGNNPIRRVDPTGMDWIERNGIVEWHKKINKDNVPDGWNYIGETYMGISVSQSEGEIDSNGIVSVTTRFYFTDAKGKKRNIGGWVQTVDTNAPRAGDSNPMIDPSSGSHDNFPYYHSRERFNVSQVNAYWQRGADHLFYDRPTRESVRGNFTWNAELSLIESSVIGKTISGKNISVSPDLGMGGIDVHRYTPVITLSWGFYQKNGRVGTYPVKVITPSDFHKEAINKIK